MASTTKNDELVDRVLEDLDERLKRLGARLKRIADHLEKTGGEA